MMKLVLRAFAKPGTESQKEVLEAICAVVQPADLQVRAFRDYWKMPDRKEVLLEMQTSEKPLDVLVSSIGSQPVWQNAAEVIFDIRQGSVIAMVGIEWLHLEVVG